MSDTQFEIQGYFEYVPVDIDVLDDERLNPIEKITFAQLRRYSNAQLQSFPSIKTLAQKVNCSERSLQNALKKLIELGLITREERFENGRQTTSLYTVIGHRAECYKKSSIEENRGANFARRGEKNITGEGAKNIPQNYNQYELHTLEREAELPNSTELEFPLVFENSESVLEAQASDRKEPDKAVDFDEVCYPEDAPDIMQPTARYLLQRTGREKLTWTEISALRTLANTQVPARVQKEIDTAHARFVRQGRDLKTLRFEYIAVSLEHQPTRSTGRRAKTKKQREEIKKANEELQPQNLKYYTDEEMAELEAKIAERSRQS